MNPTLALLRAENHISTSSITTYLRCPQQYAHRYILRTPPSHRAGALAFGSAIHQALALFYSRLMEGQPEPPAEELAATFSDRWTRELEHNPPVLLDDRETPDSARDQGVKLVHTFLDQAHPPHRVLGVEEPFSIELTNPKTGSPFPERLVGVFDAVIKDNGATSILEHKTAARRWSQVRLDTDLQVTTYFLAAPLVGLTNAEVTLQVLLKTTTPALQLYTPTRIDQDLQDLLKVIAGVLCAIKAEAFYPVRDWWCRSCPYAGPCLAG